MAERASKAKPTSRRAEGTAVGCNKKKKGAPSYYPLFRTVSLTGQVLDLLHRAGRLTRSAGQLTLTLSASRFVKDKLLHLLKKLPLAAWRKTQANYATLGVTCIAFQNKV